MEKGLREIAQELKDDKKRVQLIYAFNGVGKTRLSREFKRLVESDDDTGEEKSGLDGRNILYYNAFTEDLFYWDNDLQNDMRVKLKIQPNIFTKWIFEEQGQEINISKNFQYYTNESLTPHLNAAYSYKNDKGEEVKVDAFTEVTFSYERGNEEQADNIKISKGEESCFIWSIFYSLLSQIIEVLNIDEDSIYQERETDAFDNLKYVFIDDPVTSLDENHLIEFAVDLAELIKKSRSDDLKFIITTHNPLFYNVLSNEFNNKNTDSGYNPNKHFKKSCLTKTDNSTYEMQGSNDSPFAYHLFLLNELKQVAETGEIYKYHFSFMRNILEKMATFLGYTNWGDLLAPIRGDKEAYIKRILNLSSHSKHSAEETVMITDEDKKVLINLVNEILAIYRFNSQ